jgi:ribosomal protein S18 acetylase RimI-like enzyme
MIPVETSDDVYRILQTVKQRARGFVTNFFPSRPKLESWIGRRELSVTTAGAGALFLRRGADFSHLYFFAADIESLCVSLGAFLAAEPGTIVADILGREGEINAMADALAASGFSHYTRLIRLARLSSGCPPTAVQPGVEYAGVQDAKAITRMLHTTFDRYAEQLPVLEEIQEAAAVQRILVVRNAGEIAGLLFFEVEGFTSVLRYWLVDSGFRNQRVGSRLIRSYFAACAPARRFILWVLSDNQNAIVRYEGHGYRPDRLTDRVMIRRGAAAQTAVDKGGELG